MPSSTSSSSGGRRGDLRPPPERPGAFTVQGTHDSAHDRAPERPWLRIWLLALLVVLGVCGALERSLAAAGYRPAVTDSTELWAMLRARASQLGPEGIVLVGTSRIHSGIDPVLLGEALGRPVIQLGISASGPIPVLRSLAEDERYGSITIVDVTPNTFYSADEALEAKSQRYVDRYDERTLMTRWEPAMRSALQERARVLMPTMSATIGAALGEWRWPLPEWAHMRADRFRPLDFGGGDLEGARRGWRRFFEKSVPLPPYQYRLRLARLSEWIDAIEGRGGRVVFVRTPSAGGVLEAEEAMYPRAVYWDALVAMHPDAIHFLDHPDMIMECPEGAHLQSDEAALFTRALAARLAPLL